MQHDMRFEAGDAGEPFIADWAGEVGCCVRGLVECEVKLHVKRLRAVVTSVRLPRTDGTLTFFTGCVLYLQLTHSTPWKNTAEFRAYREDRIETQTTKILLPRRFPKVWQNLSDSLTSGLVLTAQGHGVVYGSGGQIRCLTHSR